jgi:2-dehydropantoate 2-reductase
MRIGILGRGAIGTIFAGALAQVSGVRAVGRDDSIATLVDAELLIVAVKDYDTVSALQRVRDGIPRRTPILSLQNGVDQVAHVTAAMGPARTVILAPTTEAAARNASGFVQRTGRGTTVIGWAAGRDGDLDLDRLVALFCDAGLDARRAAPIEPYLWSKLVANAAINPITALAQQPNGFIVENAAARERAIALAEEAAQVASAEGIRLPFDDAGEYALGVARASAGNHSSMLQDVLRGAPTEIDALNGKIVRLGRAHGIATPQNARMLDEVRRAVKA